MSDFKLSAAGLERVEELKNYYPDKKSAVMPLLQLTQEEQGLISEEAIVWIADQLEMSPVHVRELVTFYSMYSTKERGRYHFQVCRTLSCAVLGSKKICETLSERFKVAPGEVTEDGKWSYEQVECLGSCGTAPMCEINDTYFENLTPEKVNEIIDLIEVEQPDLSFSTAKDELGEGLKGRTKSEVWK